jgi:hypothetical protein
MAGTLCAIDGSPGWLKCVPTERTNPYDSRSTRQHDAATAQKLKDDAYAAYDSEITDAWRNK